MTPIDKITLKIQKMNKKRSKKSVKSDKYKSSRKNTVSQNYFTSSKADNSNRS